MARSANFTKFVNKRLSRISKFLNAAKVAGINLVIIVAAYVFSWFSRERKKKITTVYLKTKQQGDVVINCAGCTDLGSIVSKFGEDMKTISSILKEADISFTSSRYGEHSSKRYSALRKRFKQNRIVDVSFGNKMIQSRIYRTEAGNVAVCAVKLNYASARKHHIRIEMLKEYYLLKRMGAEYVLMYIDHKYIQAVTEKNKQLCSLLLKVGVDYIVNVKPNVIDAGVTYQKGETVSRCIYSIGTFMSNRRAFTKNRVVVRIKLRRVNGKLQAYEEAYHPLRHINKVGFIDLKNQEETRGAADLKALAEIETKMRRMRRSDRVLTVGKVADLIQVPLTAKFEYLRDFSVGKICARSFEVRPGDVFFFREQFNDANDLEKITPKQYLKIAKKAAKNNPLFMFSFRKLSFARKYVVCDNVMEAHITVCAYLRSQFKHMKTIGITGSIGKTSTKDMLTEVLKQKYQTAKSEQNTNVQVKIAMNLQQLNSACEMYVQEIGGGRPGGASRHSRMINPDVTLVTNIGDAHIGNYGGDQRELMNNKLRIMDGMDENGILFLNGDDPLLAEAKPECKTIYYAVHNTEADYYAENLVVEGNKTYFDIVYDGNRVPACVNVPGEHNVLNAVGSFAIGKHFDIPEEDMVKGIANFATQGIRQNIVEASGMKLFFDCYNASSGSIESSSRAFLQIPIPEYGRRIAVVGDITGLGELAESTHKEMATTLLEYPADIYIFYGNNTQFTYEIMKEKGCEAYYTSNYEKLCQMLIEMARPGDAVMAKGSSKMQLEYAFDFAFGTRAFDTAMIEDGVFVRTEASGVAYNLFHTHATAVRPRRTSKNVTIKEKIGLVTVYNLAASFGSAALETVKLPATIRHIGNKAFLNCAALKTVQGAVNLKYIGSEAFKNCTSLEEFTLPETVLHIDEEAFYGCSNLKELYIPASVAQIGPNAFEACPNLKIYCKAGSYAEQYLKNNNLDYTNK